MWIISNAFYYIDKFLLCHLVIFTVYYEHTLTYMWIDSNGLLHKYVLNSQYKN